MDEQKVIAILQACKPLANRLMSEGPNMSLDSLTDQEQVALQDFENLRAYGFSGEQTEQLGRKAGIGSDTFAMLERLYNRLRVERDPVGKVREADAYQHLEGQEQA